APGCLFIDRRVHYACLSFTVFRQAVDSGAIVWADDAEALAKATGLPAGEVAGELTVAAAVARGEGLDRFGRTDFEAPLEPPYAAARIVPALFHTHGGLVLDWPARVPRPYGTPIPVPVARVRHRTCSSTLRPTITRV